jgi:DNA polymerase III sliding clamp (beta) subunit (PCNA family)
MKKTTLTEDKAEQTPTGGVLVGKRKGQTIIHDKGTMSGYLVGKTHAEGGIKAVNKSTGQPLEMQGGEVVITAPAVSDQTKNEFNGKMMTNREILSQINVNGGGVAFADGGDISKVKHTGASYNYGGRTMTDYEIIQEINSCSCEHLDYKKGGGVNYVSYKDKYNKKYNYAKNKSHTLEEISKDTGVSMKGLQQIYNKGIGAYKTNPSSVRPNVKSKEQWAMARVYSAVMGGKASKVDSNELKMQKGGHLAEGLSLRDIADIHNISIAELKKQVRAGLKVESEHTASKREQMKIVKDHLLENPKYYTLLEKAGLAKGGLIAPNGNKSNLTAEQYKLVRTPEFKEWFGDWENDPENASKVVDENGEPMVVYHGTKDEFYEFDVDKQRIGWLGKGFYFTEDKRFSKDFGKRVIKSFLNLRNPFIVQADTVNDDGSVNFSIGREAQVKEKYGYVNSTDISETLKENNVDGIIEGDMLSCFYPNQIKLADGTNTTFNSSSNDIRYDKGGSLGEGENDKVKYLIDRDLDTDIAEHNLKMYLKEKGYSDSGNGLLSDEVKSDSKYKELKHKFDIEFSKSRNKPLYKYSKTRDRVQEQKDLRRYKEILNEVINDKMKKGGSLVEDSKKGNTPARDLNNYNDVLDVDADGVVGAETGLYANGGDVDFDVDGTGGADASSGVGAFDNGGEVDEFAQGGEVYSPYINNWDNVNSSWKDTSKVKKVVWANNPYDEGLNSILAPFLGHDDLRPVMSGMNFDENGITATNAHLLITLPYPNKKYEGIYEPDLSKRKDLKQITIDGRYPNYERVIPFSSETTHFLIDVYKLLQYTIVAIKYANKTTHQVVYKIDNKPAGFNGRFMIENLKTLLKLGHEKIYAHKVIDYKSRPLILSPSKDYRLGNDELLLVMPVMIETENYGAKDIDFERELSVYFDFDDNEIHNADGSVAEFKMKYQNNSPVDKKDIELLQSMVSKNKTLAILDNVLIKDGVLRSTNLYSEYLIKNVDVSNGVYFPIDGNLEITMKPIDDFPREPIFVYDENTIEFVIPSNVFEYYIQRFLFVTKSEDANEVFKGICLKHTSDNRLYLMGTDSYLGLIIEITKYVDIPLYNKEIKTVIDPVWLFRFLKEVQEGALHIKSNKVSTFIDSDSKSFYCRNIDGNYPNLEGVVPNVSDKLVSIKFEDFKKCFNNEFIEKYKKQTQKTASVDIFDKGNDLFVGRRFGKNSELVYVEKLCDVKINSENEIFKWVGQSILLIMPERSSLQDNFCFDLKRFSNLISIVNDSEIQLHYSEKNRAYISNIHSFEYEKTTIEHKTREQKPTLEQEQMIAEVEEIDEIKEAIEVMQMLLETAPKKDKKEIVEAIEVMEMLLESYQN